MGKTRQRECASNDFCPYVHAERESLKSSRGMKALILILIVTLIIGFACPLAQAGVEAVVVKKTMDDKAIVVRANGEM